MVIEASDVESLLNANSAFYQAFEASDLDAMSQLWMHDDDAFCTHPGWGTLHGWGKISASWFALFQQPHPLQFILTDERAHVLGDVGWVTVDENVIGPEAGETVAALNLFERVDGSWRLRAHHGSPVAPHRPEL